MDQLIWCRNDNGAAIVQLQREWLSSNDREKVQIALEMNEIAPFKDAEEMRAMLDAIKNTWPELKANCEKMSAVCGEILKRKTG